MRRVAIVLLLAALLLGVARLFTGVAYGADAPIAALVVKRTPGVAVEWTETAAHPIDRDIVLDREEPRLFYQPLYLWAMRWTPLLAPVMALAALLLLARERRRA